MRSHTLATTPGRHRPANSITSSAWSWAGADSLDNIWPQCGPDGVALHERFFKQKDLVESYLHAQVRDQKMALSDAQRGATDWTQFLDTAKAFCASDPSC